MILCEYDINGTLPAIVILLIYTDVANQIAKT